MAGPRAGHALATQDGAEHLVVTVTDEFQAALADADDARFASVAVPWSQTEEFFGGAIPRSWQGCSASWLSLPPGPATG